MQVAELPGIYGPVSISERVLQRIWAQQDLVNRSMTTRCGKSLRIQHPGRWNQAEEGPDFKEAVIELDGQQVVGDVEVHFYAHDWENHGHHIDPEYQRVCLHVVLFEPRQAVEHQLPTVVLGPYLREDIEGYLLSRHENGDVAYLFEQWSELTATTIRKRLLVGAKIRWQQKLAFAKTRIDKLGFDAAMHSITMEILGYRRNRDAMAEAAYLFPVDIWSASPPAPSAVMAASSKPWKKSGMRPANLPEKRLQQYRELWLQCPEWIQNLASLAWPELPLTAVASVSAYRKQVEMPALRAKIEAFAGKGGISGTRLDTLITDGWLPIISAFKGIHLQGLWSAWYTGDFPDNFREVLRQHRVTDGRASPQCNAWNQGLLQVIFTR